MSPLDPSFPVSAALLAATGFAAGIINVLAGGGSLLTLPVLIFVGLPPTVANGTNRVAILAQNVAASWSFRRHGLLPMGWLRLAAPPALAGAVLGIWLATQVGEATLQRFLAGIMVAVAIWTLWNPVKPRQDGDGEPPAGAWARAGLRVAFFGVGIYGGFIQAGLGFFILALLAAGGLDIIRGNALKVALVLVFTPLALAGFAFSGMVDWALGASLAVGNLLGALVGVRLNMTRGESWVRGFVVVMVIIFALRLWFSA